MKYLNVFMPVCPYANTSARIIMVYFNFAHAVMPMDSLQALEFLNDSWRVRSAQIVELKS
jgi:hypothetical protein